MGHYLSEMWAPWHDGKQELKYNQKARKEITDLIETNPLKLKDLEKGDKVKIYSPLETTESKVYYKGYDKVKHPVAHNIHLITNQFFHIYFDYIKKSKNPMVVESVKDSGYLKFNLLGYEVFANFKLFEKID